MNIKQKISPFALAYLRFFARLQLQKNRQAKIVGITGSAGKTSCQLAILAALGNNKGRFKIKINKKANSETGIPLDILGLQVKNYRLSDWLRLMLLAPWQLLTNWQHFDVYVVEMGIDSPHSPKNMDYLLSIIQPQIAILLNAKIVHSQNFDQLVKEIEPKKREQAILSLIAKEKSKLALSLTKNALVIINRDDQLLWQFSQQSLAEINTFSQDGSNHTQDVDLRLSDWQVDLDASQFSFEINKRVKLNGSDNKILTIKLNNVVLGQHYAPILASAILLGLRLGLSKNEIKNNLEKYFVSEPGRSSLLKAQKNSYILDSSYNASGMLEMLDLAKHLANKDRRVKRLLAILGDMRELGEETASLHQQVADKITEDFSEVYLVGPLMERYVQPILQEKIRAGASTIQKLETFKDSRLAGAALLKNLQAGDLVLLKGSQNEIYLEKAIEPLLADKTITKKVLCRQSAYWLGVKNQQKCQ